MTNDTNASSTLEVSIKMRNTTNGETEVVLTTEAQLSRTEALQPGDICEERLYVSIVPGELPNYADARVSCDGNYKITKADAGIR